MEINTIMNRETIYSITPEVGELNKITRPLDRLTKEKVKRQITAIRNEWWKHHSEQINAY